MKMNKMKKMKNTRPIFGQKEEVPILSIGVGLKNAFVIDFYWTRSCLKVSKKWLVEPLQGTQNWIFSELFTKS